MQKPEPLDKLTIPLQSLNTSLIIYSEGKSECFGISPELALESNESPFQILEGNFYEFKFENSEKYTLVCNHENVVNLSRDKFRGRICPNIYVGKLELQIQEISSGDKIEKIYLEVLATKFDSSPDASYRDNYRMMLEEITEQCTDLLMQINSPVQQSFTIDFEKNPQTIYQRFCFVNSIINNEDFENAVQQVVKNPSVAWDTIAERIPIHKVRRIDRSVIRQITSGSARVPSGNDYLNRIGLSSLPQKIEADHKIETFDTNENRFIKHALETFLQFADDCESVFREKNYNSQAAEAKGLSQKLDSFLNQPFFKEISKPDSLQLNSPLLQRRAGYREILNRWLQFDLAAKLIWEGGDDVYSGGKKNIATLYEYWLFFKLLNLFQSYFRIPHEELSKLIVPKDKKLSLQLKQGRNTALQGVFDIGNRKLNVKFSYNRSFGSVDGYPKSGSWTTTMRPDYTLSFWPAGMKEHMAENDELIVHIHFDAKYKVDNFYPPVANDEAEEEEYLNKEKLDNRKGIYKNADLLKMHAYKDAIRRTGGAYVLYPGTIDPVKKRGFHEIIPGLGAFPVRPSQTDDGIEHLKLFIGEVIEHFSNRTSQREKQAYRTFDIHKDKPSDDNIVNDVLPETYGQNRGLFADEAFVLVGYYKSAEHLEWIKNNMTYNFRMSSPRGSLRMNKETILATFLLLHSEGDKGSDLLFRISGNAFEVMTKKQLEILHYPDPNTELYLTTKIEEITDSELQNISWNFKLLENYKSGRSSALPFTASLKELMRCRLT